VGDAPLLSVESIAVTIDASRGDGDVTALTIDDSILIRGRDIAAVLAGNNVQGASGRILICNYRHGSTPNEAINIEESVARVSDSYNEGPDDPPISYEKEFRLYLSTARQNLSALLTLCRHDEEASQLCRAALGLQLTQRICQFRPRNGVACSMSSTK
jgi:hypothetical protein